MISVQNMDTEHLFPIPKVEIFLSDLAELCRSPYMADAGLAGMREDLVVHDSAPLVIKPVADGCSTGVMCLQEPEHLLTYAMAVAQEWDEIPADLSPGAAPSSYGCKHLSVRCIVCKLISCYGV